MFAHLLLSESSGWLDKYFNYPGLEAWKFLNLAIFIAVGMYLLREPISQALLSRGERIERELATARKEKEAALLRQTEAEALLARRDEDIRVILEQAHQEAHAEKDRLADLAESEIVKLKLQGQREIETASKLARKSLRRFLAERSVALARDSVRAHIKPEDDKRLVVESIGELRRNRV
jgi:F-type H+-transporting ATPase subunit b